MTEHIPKRRRRGPNKAKRAVVPKPAAVVHAEMQQPTAVERQNEAEAAPPKRRRRASVGEFAMKLDAPTRPGFVRRFFNDTGNRLATAGELGYSFVEDANIKTDDPSSRITRLAGTQPNGAPLKTYLMETPDELYAEGVAEKEAHNRKIDDAITAGVDSTGQTGPKSETYGHGSIERDR